MLIKVRCTAEQRRQLSDLANIFRGTVCDVSLSTMTIEIQGKEDKLFALQQLLQPYGKHLPPHFSEVALFVALTGPFSAGTGGSIPSGMGMGPSDQINDG